jgi:uncharacterized membrane protein
MHSFAYRAGAALFTAAAIVGLGTVTGAPLDLATLVTSAAFAGVAVQAYLAYLERRQTSKP